MSIALDRERVERGVRWLDEHGPSDWFDRINLEDFDIAFPRRCVLGQLYAEEARAAGFNSGWGWAIDHYDLTGHSNGFTGAELMTDLWREKIIALRVATAKEHVRALREEELVCV